MNLILWDSPSKAALQFNHRHPYHSLGSTPCILCTVLQTHGPTATSSHYFRSSGSTKKGAKYVLPSQRGSLKPGQTWTRVRLCGESGGPRSLTFDRIKPLLHRKWPDWLMLQGTNTLPAMITQKSNLPEK